MEIADRAIFETAQSILRGLYGADASFREGQYEAIEATLLHHRTLVVQKTGWGKSLVYFICTKILRAKGKGLSLIVSPLLALMDNQVAAARAMGLRCDTLNSSTKARQQDILQAVQANELDLILTTPETLFSEKVQGVFTAHAVPIGLFVVDEVHCISDWGHDFRLDYCNLYQFLRVIPTNIPILATTATANDRVIDDLKKQLGEDVYLSRGPLMRRSLSIQVLHLPDNAQRYAWILQNIKRLPGSGIIYCLTRRDCDYLADFLSQNGLAVRSYYSREEDALNQEAEQLFKENKIKALVATIKLGMGYDKGDIAFVIHFQQPSNIVSYYQQIGRAGRNIPRAYTFLMCGAEDIQIQDYFINTAFPTKAEAESVHAYIFEHTEQGVTRCGLETALNLKHARIEKALLFLQNEGYITKEKSKYYATVKKFYYDEAHYAAVTAIRRAEQQQMLALTRTAECYNRFVVNALDDPTTEVCGICKNCLGYEEYPSAVEQAYLELAQKYLDRLSLPIEPRRKWASTAFSKAVKIETPNALGLCLSKYGDPGYGSLVKQDKYSGRNRFCDELIGKSAQMLRPLVVTHRLTAVTCVPSLRSDIVVTFSGRLAERLGLPFVQLLGKKSARPQKTMENSSHQCENARAAFFILEDHPPIPKNILLVDDIVDSKWTLTVCGFLLRSAGADKVVPFALADSAQTEG